MVDALSQMVVLGLNLGHNPSAALLDGNGLVLAAAHESRLTRFKKERRFPRRAIASVLRGAHRHPSEVRVVAYSSYEADSVRLILDKFLCGVGDARKSAQALIDEELQRLGVKPVELVREDHHFAHACGARMACPALDALLITADGYGDGLSFTARWSNRGQVPQDPLVAAPLDASLGLVYQYVTGGLGYSMLSEEWKVLGLEPYGDPAGAADLFEGLMDNGPGLSSWNADKLRPWAPRDGVRRRLSMEERMLSLRRFMELKVPTLERADVASAVQAFVEWRIITQVEQLRLESGTHLALAGGTFLNVKLNRLLSELDWVADVSVFPAAGDGGNAVGAALAYLHRTQRVPPCTGIRSLYWGELHTADVPRTCDIAGLHLAPVEETETIESLSSAIAEGRIVAIARGRGEFGPRALLNRSFVCRADRIELTALLTEGLGRDPVMPYGCSMLDREVAEALEDPGPLLQCLRFMIAAPRVKDGFGRRYRAVCHPLRTGGLSTRPQVVADDDSWQARLLRAVGRKTGGAVVLNTSFNLHGEPIVETPADALATFQRAAIPGSLLLLEDRLLSLEMTEEARSFAARPVPRLPQDEPRRRRESCVCFVLGASAKEESTIRKGLQHLGLTIAAEATVDGPEARRLSRVVASRLDDRSAGLYPGRALLIVGSEAPSLVERWAGGFPRREGLFVATAKSDLESSRHLALFPQASNGSAGPFADLLLWLRGMDPTRALDVLLDRSPLAFAGFLETLDELQQRPERFPSVERRIAVVYGTSVPVPAPPGGRMYLYAPEGRDALIRLATRLAAPIQTGDFLQCRQGGLVLAYAPPTGALGVFEKTIHYALGWQIDALVAVAPDLSLDAAERIERMARDRDLAILGGTDCAVTDRAIQPLGVRSSGLGRFIHRFPGLEL